MTATRPGPAKFKNVGTLLRERRHVLKLERPALAKVVGVGVKSLDNWEMGYRRPRWKEAAGLAAVLWRDDEAGATQFLKAAGLLSRVEREWGSTWWDLAMSNAKAGPIPAEEPGGQDADAGSTDAVKVTDKLRGRGLRSLLKKGVAAILRRGFPIPIEPSDDERAALGYGQGSNDDDALEQSFRYGIRQSVEDSDLEEHSLSKLDLYYIGDDSFSHLGLHSDCVLIVCQKASCAAHEGLLLCRDDNLHPRFVPSRPGQHVPRSKLDLGERIYTVVGHVIGTVHLVKRAASHHSIQVTSEIQLPERTLRLGLMAWPDSFLVAWRVLHERHLRMGEAARISNSEIQCVVRSHYDDMIGDLKEGRLDAVVATLDPRLGGTAFRRIALYEYRGNRFYMRDGHKDFASMESFFKESEKQPRELLRLLGSRRIAVNDGADDINELVEFLIHHLDLSKKTAREELREKLGVELLVFNSQDDSSVGQADLLWWGPNDPPAVARKWMPVSRFEDAVRAMVYVHYKAAHPYGEQLAKHVEHVAGKQLQAEDIRAAWLLMAEHLGEATTFVNFRALATKALVWKTEAQGRE